MKPALLHGRGGLGDAVWMRPFVRAAASRWTVYVDTSWPEMYADLPATVIRRKGGLALQRHHGDKHPAETWAKAPARAWPISLRYRWSELNRRSMLAEMELVSGLRPDPLVLDLPPLPTPPVSGRYAVIRPPAARLDYPGPAREPLLEYMVHAAEAVQATGLPLISLGAFVPGLEAPAGTVPADIRYEQGELSLMRALALVAGAEVVVTSPGWMIPVGMAAKVPVIAIAGGCGGRNNPEAIVDSRLDSRVTWLLPDQYCRCRNRIHECPKVITDFGARFAAALNTEAVAA